VGAAEVTFSVALAVKDNPLPLGSKVGDIIAVKPAGWKWGTEEVKRFLLVEVDFPTVTKAVLRRLLTLPQYAGGVLAPADDTPVAITGKRRFGIRKALLDSAATATGVTMDWAKLADPKVEYQPLKGKMLTGTTMIRDKVLARELTGAQLGALG
jgi:hypothetical protein